ncbi:MAG: hypothetical protein GY761_05300 [Hyphomicrobiales bacterium]|nr:hypothetical protein [Hyphomicrobiales bacterium]
MPSILRIVLGAMIALSLAQGAAFGQAACSVSKEVVVKECLAGPCELTISAAIKDLDAAQKDQCLAEIVISLAEAAQADSTKTAQAVAATNAVCRQFTDPSRGDQCTQIASALSTGVNIDTAALGDQASGN